MRWGFVGLLVALVGLGLALYVGRSVHAGQTPPPVVKEIKLGSARPGTMYALTVAVKDPARMQGSDSVLATVKDAQGVVESSGCIRRTWISTHASATSGGPGDGEPGFDWTGSEVSTSLRKILAQPILVTEWSAGRA